MDSQKPMVVVFGQFPPYPDPSKIPQRNSNISFSLFSKSQRTSQTQLKEPASQLDQKTQENQTKSNQNLSSAQQTINIQPIIQIERPIYIDVPLQQPIVKYSEVDSQISSGEDIQQKQTQISNKQVTQDPIVKQIPQEQKKIEEAVPLNEKELKVEIKQEEHHSFNFSDLCLEWRYVSLLSMTGFVYLLGRGVGMRGARLGAISALLLSYPMLPELKEIMKWKLHFLKRRMRCYGKRRWSRKHEGSYF